MRIALIAALSDNGVIGRNNQLPWHYPEDLRYFKSKTLGKPIIMGRKTFESMNSRPLPQRENIILTKDLSFHAKNCKVVHTKEEALAKALKVYRNSENCNENGEEVMVIGGEEIFKLFLPDASRLYLTFIHLNIDGDTFFPKVNWTDWQKVSEEKKAELSWMIFDKIEKQKTNKEYG